MWDARRVRDPRQGSFVRVRSRLYLVDQVAEHLPGEDALVHLSCLDDDAQGACLSVLWQREVDWRDVPTACEFILDHDDGPDEDEEAGKKRKRKPYRLRWPDEVRDEVLARLIELNRARAEDERKRGVAVTRRAREADDDEDADADG